MRRRIATASCFGVIPGPAALAQGTLSGAHLDTTPAFVTDITAAASVADHRC